MLEKRLKEYKSNLSKLHVTECEIIRLEKELKQYEPSYISAVQYSDMPKSQTNKITSVVENTVLEIERDQELIDNLKNDLRQMKLNREEYKLAVEYVQALMEALTEQERFIIELFVIDNLPWYIVADRYSKAYGFRISRDTVTKKRKTAQKKMRAVCGE